MKFSRFFKIKLSILVGLFASHSLYSVAQDQPGITEIIVKPSLQGREESLEDVSISVSSLDGDTMVEAGIGKIEDLAAYVPNFTMTETPIGNLIFIRGIGSGLNQGFEQSVGIYSDGIYYGRSQLSRAPFLDLQQADILRGPQVTLFGNNSVAGAVNLTSARPTDEFEFSTTLLYGQENGAGSDDFAGHGEREVTVIASGPVTDTFGVRFAYKHSASDGYMENLINNDFEPTRENHTARLTFGWEFDSWDMALKLEANKFKTTGRQLETIQSEPTAVKGGGKARARLTRTLLDPTLSNVDDNTTWQQVLFKLLEFDEANLDTEQDYKKANNPIDVSDNEMYNATFNTSFYLGDYQLKTTSGYMQYTFDEICDCDFTTANLVSPFFREDYRVMSQEFRIISPVDDVFDFIAGVYWQKDDLDYIEKFGIERGGDQENLLNAGLANYTKDDFDPFVFPDLSSAGLTIAGFSIFSEEGADSRRDFNQTSEVNAIFGQGTFHLADDRARLILGARFTHTEKKAYRFLRIMDRNAEQRALNNGFINGVATAIIGGVFNVMPHELQDKRTEDKLSFSSVLEVDLNDEALMYLSFTRGYKSGGFDVRSNVEPDDDLSTGIIDNPSLDGRAPGISDTPDRAADPLNPFTSTVQSQYPGGAVASVTPGSFEFEDEKVSNAEIGLKLTFGDSAVMGYNVFNMNYFYTEFKNLQVSTFDGTLGFNVGNAAAAVSQGIEIDGRVQLLPFYILGGALAYLDFRFNEYPRGSCPGGFVPDTEKPVFITVAGDPVVANNLEFCDYSGQRNSFVPDWSGLISNNFFFPLNREQTVILRTTFDVQFSSDFLTATNLDSRTRQDSFARLNTRISVGDIIPGEDGKWEVALLGRNLTNEAVVPFTVESPLAFSQTGAISHLGFVDRPRSVVLQGTFKF